MTLGFNVEKFKSGMIFSASLHLSIVVVGLVGMPYFMSDSDMEPTIVPVEMVEIDDVARTTEPRPENNAPSEYVPPTTRDASAPASAVDSRAEAAKPVPMPNVRPRLKPKPKPAPVTPPKVEPRVKPKPPSRLDRSRLAALIDKSKKEDTAPTSKTEVDEEAEKTDKPTEMSPLEARRATMTIIGAIQRQVSECWSFPAGAKGAENLIIPIRIQLTPDGNLMGAPDIQNKDAMSSNGYYRVAAEAATRAIRRCAPFELPKDRYDMWRDIILNFNPSEMLGG